MCINLLGLFWLSEEKVKGLLQLERVMVYAKAYYFFKCDNFLFFIVRGQITIVIKKMKGFGKF